MVKKTIVFIFLFALLAQATPILKVHAQSTELTAAQADRAKLEAELIALEAEIKKKEAELSGQKGQSASLNRDIAVLKTKISKSQLDIKAKNLTIQKLSGEIKQKSSAIQNLTEKIEVEKDSLAQLIRKNQQIDNQTLLALLISNNSLYDMYGDVDAFNALKQAISASVQEIKGDRAETEMEKKSLEEKQDAESDAKAALEKDKKQVENNEKEKQKLLSISKDKEKEYQKIIAEQQKKVADIRARLFNLAGGSQAIRFDVALGYAEEASTRTGVEPAFILAIITQESKLGANVGKCYLTDTTTGAGVSTTGKAWSNLMKPSRDVGPFLEITSALALNAFKTVVSCPIAGVAGYGGAMGPAQFIPSTWKIFESRVKKITGSANPWAPRDAFTASALYLADLGGTGSSQAAQKKAACKYYGSGGTSCSYGNSVIKLKDSIQDDIDYLKEYGVSKR